jgi:PKD repeat protein
MAVSHTYGTGGDYVVTLTVVNDRGTTATASQHITLNSPPAASFTSTCIGLTCTLNASGSSDLDGTIVNYAWNFGDGRIGSGAALTHTYAVGGSYAVTLLVTDNGGATGTRTMTVTVIPPSIHIGDLDGTSMSNGPIWTATVTITVHDGAHVPVANAVVSGTWNDGSTGSCATDAIGRCAVARLGIPRRIGSVRFAVTNDALAGFIYKPSGNHDPDGDSDGTTITIAR